MTINLIPVFNPFLLLTAGNFSSYPITFPFLCTKHVKANAGHAFSNYQFHHSFGRMLFLMFREAGIARPSPTPQENYNSCDGGAKNKSLNRFSNMNAD